MKTKTSSTGNKYIFFEDDIELEAIALRLVSLLPKHSGSIGKPLKLRLWDCAIEHLENAPKNSVVFKRCQTIGDDIAEERVFSLMKEVINEIVKVAKAEDEKVVVMSWNKNKTRTTENGILVRYTTNGKFIGLKTLTDVLIGNKKDIDGLLKRMNTDIENITWAEFNRIVDVVKQDQSRLGDGIIKEFFKSVRVAFEDILTEKEIDAKIKTKTSLFKTDNWENDIDILG